MPTDRPRRVYTPIRLINTTSPNLRLLCRERWKEEVAV